MNEKRLVMEADPESIEAVNTFTDALLDQGAHTEPLPKTSLASLICTLSETLYPIEPSNAFVDSLRQQLMADPEFDGPSGMAQGRWVRTLMSMFMIIGIASRVIGGIVLLSAILRKRKRQTSPA